MHFSLRRFKRGFGIITLFAAAIGGQLPLAAQGDSAGTAAVSGTVLDASGTAIQQADVAVTNEASGAVRSAITAADGRFTIGNLPAGVYSVAVAANGFSVDT